jgi:hypothetical protein
LAETPSQILACLQLAACAGSTTIAGVASITDAVDAAENNDKAHL